MSVGMGRRPGRKPGVGTAKPSGGTPTPADEPRSEPPEQNKVGEAQRREIAELKRRLDDKDKQDSGDSEAKSVLAAINKGLGKPGLPAASPRPKVRPPHPDLYYDNPDKYEQDMEEYTKSVAGQEAEGRVLKYDRSRNVKDQKATRDDHNDRVTKDFIDTHSWLQGEDGDAEFARFQQHIHDTGIEGRGPGGSLTEDQLVAAERSYRFEEMMGESASATEAGIVNRMRAGQRSSSPRGSTPTPSTVEDAIESDPRLAVRMLRQYHDENGDEALTERFDKIPQALRRKILPYFQGADR